jgi:hypothetical protein
VLNDAGCLIDNHQLYELKNSSFYILQLKETARGVPVQMPLRDKEDIAVSKAFRFTSVAVTAAFA